MRTYHQDTVSLLFRQLPPRYVPTAQHLLTVCLAAVRRAVEVYLTNGADPKVSSSDPQIDGLAGNNPQLIARAGQLLTAEPVAPLGGGSLGPESWELFINENVVMDFHNLGTFDDFVTRQDAIGRRADERRAMTQAGPPVQLPDPTAAPSDSGPRRIFVVMPFGPEWSIAVYELIKRAANALDLEPAAIVERADDITKPGRITQQIVDSTRYGP